MRNLSPSLPRLLRSAPPALLATPPKCMQPSLEPARTYSYPPGSLPPSGMSQLPVSPSVPVEASAFVPISRGILLLLFHPPLDDGPLRSHPPRVRRLPLALPRHFEDSHLLLQPLRVCVLEVGCLACPGSSPLRSIRRLRHSVCSGRSKGNMPLTTWPHTSLCSSRPGVVMLVSVAPTIPPTGGHHLPPSTGHPSTVVGRARTTG